STTIAVRSISASVSAGLVGLQRRRSVGAWRDAEEAPEHRGEVTRGSESDQSRDLGDRQLRRGQDAAGAGDPLADHESVGRHPGAVLEEAREVVGTHADHGRELGEREVFVEVLLDVVGHSPESGPGQGVAVRTRVRCRHHGQRPSAVGECRAGTARLRVSTPWHRTFSPVRARSTTPVSRPASSCRTRTMRVMYSPRCSGGSIPSLPWSFPISILSWSLYAGVRVRIVPGSVKNSVSGGGRGGGGRVGYGILSDASCRQSGGVLKPEVRLKVTVLGGFHAQLEP